MSFLRRFRPSPAAPLTAVLVAMLLLPPPALGQKKVVSLSFTKELLYNIARDNDGEMKMDIIRRLKGLSPVVNEVDIIRSGGDVTLAYRVTAGDDLPVNFNLTLEKMAFYRMAAAREDIDGMLAILRPAAGKEPLILGLAYRYDEHYSIVEVVLDLGPAVRARDEAVRKTAAAMAPPPKKPPPPKAEPAPEPEPEPKRKEPPKVVPEQKPEPAAAPPKVREKKAAPEKAPEKKKEPAYLAAVPRGKTPPPLIDGSQDDPAWRLAQPFPARVRGASGDVTATLSALHDTEKIYLLARWPDARPDLEHRPWTWSGETGEYVAGKESEDAFAVQFAREERIGDCMLSGRAFTADLWFWRAARTNPVGFADDATLTVSTERIAKSNYYTAKNKKTVWVKERRDSGSSPYRTQVAGTFEGEKVQRYVPRPPTGSAADVSAKGSWEKGYWTLEMERKLKTADSGDVEFGRRDIYFSVALFDGRERSEHSTSSELLLRLE